MAKRRDKTVLFLCTGNYYRSRFAEVLFNSVAGKMGLAWQASSRGLALERGVNNVGPIDARPRRHVLRPLQGPASREDGKASEDDSLRFGQQVMAPVDRRL